MDIITIYIYYIYNIKILPLMVVNILNSEKFFNVIF
jgi:hypothetical protein